MFKILVSFFCFLLIFQVCTVNAASTQPHSMAIQCAPQLKHCLDKIQKLPEARKLIATIQKEGSIRIAVNNDHHLSKEFGAFWDPAHRVITVNYSSHRSEGSLIASIIFEMHNASVNSKINHLDYLASKGQIDRDSYVEGIERLEYKNSINASKLAQQGIKKGIFPKTAHLPTYSNFDEHYRIQKEGGHSAYIAKNYDQIAPRKARNIRFIQ